MDFVNEMGRFFSGLGYGRARTAFGVVWLKEEDQIVKLIRVVPEVLPGQNRQPVEEQEEQMQALENQLMIRFGKKTDRLTIMLFRGLPEEKNVEEVREYPNIWCVDKNNGRVFLYEKQRSDFYGLRDSLEQFIGNYKDVEKRRQGKELTKMFQPANTLIVVINAAVFLVLCMLGNVTDAQFMAEHGAMAWAEVMEQGEYYRLLTSTFLHFGVEHLLQNMLILLLIGSRLERIIGKIRYLAVYLGAGIIASLSSLFFTLAGDPYTVSAGASGAIFGVMGGLLFMILKDVAQKKRRRIEEIGLTGIIFVIVSALSYGFTASGVDNAAHLGGLAAGFILTGILLIWK